MKVFLDTNVLVDYLNKREPFFAAAAQIIDICGIFEDAVQYFSAQQAGADLIITRDADGFQGFDLPVMTPAEFLTRCTE